jgi:hypothetical protein
MRQYLYTSRSIEFCREPALDAILEVSRHNNALEGLSGLLWADGTSFLQVLEGDDQAVSSLIDRLIKDPRHRDMVPLVDRKIETREFGYWAMAMPHRGESGEEFKHRVHGLVAGKSDDVRGPVDALLAMPVRPSAHAEVARPQLKQRKAF